MSKPKHTPGPWIIKTGIFFDERGRLREYTWVGGGPVGDERPVMSTNLHSEAEANSRLIAVAPDLLKFVELVLKDQLSFGEHGDMTYISAAQTLIAKIEGK